MVSPIFRSWRYFKSQAADVKLLLCVALQPLNSRERQRLQSDGASSCSVHPPVQLNGGDLSVSELFHVYQVSFTASKMWFKCKYRLIKSAALRDVHNLMHLHCLLHFILSEVKFICPFTQMFPCVCFFYVRFYQEKEKSHPKLPVKFLLYTVHLDIYKSNATRWIPTRSPCVD